MRRALGGVFYSRPLTVVHFSCSAVRIWHHSSQLLFILLPIITRLAHLFSHGNHDSTRRNEKVGRLPLRILDWPAVVRAVFQKAIGYLGGRCLFALCIIKRSISRRLGHLISRFFRFRLRCSLPSYGHVVSDGVGNEVPVLLEKGGWQVHVK